MREGSGVVLNPPGIAESFPSFAELKGGKGGDHSRSAIAMMPCQLAASQLSLLIPIIHTSASPPIRNSCVLAEEQLRPQSHGSSDQARTTSPCADIGDASEDTYQPLSASESTVGAPSRRLVCAVEMFS